jgi:formate dehydrogenase major subunit
LPSKKLNGNGIDFLRIHGLTVQADSTNIIHPGCIVNYTERYKKNLMVSREGNITTASESVKTILYSTDPRDFGLVRKSIPCQNACPAKTNIPGYIRCIHEKRYGRSYELNRMANILPGVLGRICSRPCELYCRHGESDLGRPVSICSLKRSASDLKSPMHRITEGLYSPSGKKVAVVGAGPAGLGAAHELSVLGHKVVLYEAFDKPGGMLMYGIPEFRLPRDVLMVEIENILRLGVELKTGVSVGKDVALDDLLAEFDSVILTTGCHAQPPQRGRRGS